MPEVRQDGAQSDRARGYYAGYLDECGGAVESARGGVEVSGGLVMGLLDDSGEKMREEDRIGRPRCW